MLAARQEREGRIVMDTSWSQGSGERPRGLAGVEVGRGTLSESFAFLMMRIMRGYRNGIGTLTCPVGCSDRGLRQSRCSPSLYVAVRRLLQLLVLAPAARSR